MTRAKKKLNHDHEHFAAVWKLAIKMANPNSMCLTLCLPVLWAGSDISMQSSSALLPLCPLLLPPVLPPTVSAAPLELYQADPTHSDIFDKS